MSANKRTGANSCVTILLQFYLGTCTFSFFQVTKQSIYMHFTPWRGYPQLAQADETEVKPHMLTTYCSSLAALSPKGSAVEGQCTAKQTLLPLQHALPLSVELPCCPLDPSLCQSHLLTQHSTSLTKWIACCQVIKPNCWSKSSTMPKSTVWADARVKRHKISWPSVTVGQKGRGPPLLASPQWDHLSHTTNGISRALLKLHLHNTLEGHLSLSLFTHPLDEYLAWTVSADLHLH